MKKFLLAAIVGMVAAVAPLPAAQADGPGWIGTCRMSTVNDTSPTETLGGQNVWNGLVNIAVAASTPAATISAASCWIRVNDGPWSKMLDAVVAGPVGIGAGHTTFTAAMSDTVEICTSVTTSSHGANMSCPFYGAPICSDSVCGDGGLLDQVTEQSTAIDPVVCPQLVAVAPAVNGLPANGLLWIDPVSGDTYVGGTAPEYLFWDCPPYVQG